ncbi:hypothetical protein M758_7G091700 [Ceratodon purpureus]|nr:hypothetical protein M758_7G091700 [Ceratodon purpureus]
MHLYKHLSKMLRQYSKPNLHPPALIKVAQTISKTIFIHLDLHSSKLVIQFSQTTLIHLHPELIKVLRQFQNLNLNKVIQTNIQKPHPSNIYQSCSDNFQNLNLQIYQSYSKQLSKTSQLSIIKVVQLFKVQPASTPQVEPTYNSIVQTASKL